MGIGPQRYAAFERSADERTFVNPVLGLGFRFPPGWVIRDPIDVARVREGRLLTDYDDLFNEIHRGLTDQYLPVVTVAPPPLDDPVARLGPHEIAPVITVHLEPTIDPDASDLWGHVMIDLAHFHARVQDYRLIERPSRVAVSECAAVTYTATYTFLHADAVGGCPTRERCIYVHQDPPLYEIRMCDYPERDPRLAYDFDEFVGTICIR